MSSHPSVHHSHNMRSLIVLAVLVAAANAGYYGGAATLVGPSTKGVYLQAPSASASLKGPDGSYIAASAPGGAVAAAPKPGGVVSASIAPGYASYGYAAPAAAYAAPAVVVAGPALGGYAAPYPAFAAGSGLEGQYVPDYTEKLYDDGQYRGEGAYGAYGAYGGYGAYGKYY